MSDIQTQIFDLQNSIRYLNQVILQIQNNQSFSNTGNIVNAINALDYEVQDLSGQNKFLLDQFNKLKEFVNNNATSRASLPDNINLLFERVNLRLASIESDLSRVRTGQVPEDVLPQINSLQQSVSGINNSLKTFVPETLNTRISNIENQIRNLNTVGVPSNIQDSINSLQKSIDAIANNLNSNNNNNNNNNDDDLEEGIIRTITEANFGNQEGGQQNDLRILQKALLVVFLQVEMLLK